MYLSLERHNYSHYRFDDILHLLPNDTVLVLNNTKVLPTKLLGKRMSGAVLEALLTREIENGKWEALIKKAKKINVVKRPNNRLRRDGCAAKGPFWRQRGKERACSNAATGQEGKVENKQGSCKA